MADLSSTSVIDKKQLLKRLIKTVNNLLSMMIGHKIKCQELHSKRLTKLVLHNVDNCLNLHFSTCRMSNSKLIKLLLTTDIFTTVGIVRLIIFMKQGPAIVSKEWTDPPTRQRNNVHVQHASSSLTQGGPTHLHLSI